jgi:hypothetical protein
MVRVHGYCNQNYKFEFIRAYSDLNRGVWCPLIDNVTNFECHRRLHY